MRKLMIGYLLASSLSLAHAQYAGPSATQVAMSVRQLQESGKDDQQVLLRGRIIKSLGDEKYQFADDTGQILVEIDDKRWPAGPLVSEKMMVELVGEFDKELIGYSKVDVDEVRVVQ